MVNMGTTSKTGVKCKSVSIRPMLHIINKFDANPLSTAGHKVAQQHNVKSEHCNGNRDVTLQHSISEWLCHKMSATR